MIRGIFLPKPPLPSGNVILWNLILEVTEQEQNRKMMKEPIP